MKQDIQGDRIIADMLKHGWEIKYAKMTKQQKKIYDFVKNKSNKRIFLYMPRKAGRTYLNKLFLKTGINFRI